MGIKPNDYDLVLVHWNDAASHENWVDLKKIQNEDTTPCVTVGWLVADKPDKLVIVASMNLDPEAEQVSGHVSIPKPMIVSVKNLSIRKPRKPKVLVAETNS